MRFSVIAASMFAGADMAATSTDYVTEEVTITSCAATVTDCPARSTQVSTTIYSRTSSTEAAPSSITPAGQPSNSGPVASGPASSAPVASAPASSAPAVSSPAPSAPASSAPATSVLVPVSSAPAPSPSADACAATCATEYNTCRSAPDANRSLCASNYASCLGYSPYDSNGSLVTPTACSSVASASAPASSAPASSAPASSKPASFTPTYATPAASSAGSSLGVVASSPAPSVSVVAITTCIPTVIYSTISLSGHETTAPGVPAASAKPSSTGYISIPANGTTPVATQTPLAFTGAAANLQVGGAAIAAVFGLAAFLL
ncbi:hypothetical protein BOTNAR_1518g00010 [Botryotinia narcissicola]|uniref:Extracellular membrane protein CFEM domain-containing protein n=1 Tax=Botryotinia narcissicola TaxID=278944 RepID=A0A4Z1H572_9HELO|nr:hypothetical protein BOTNAR_1518g00010 [Botryotinia narcissicola]